jgi:hypothetical protein
VYNYKPVGIPIEFIDEVPEEEEVEEATTVDGEDGESYTVPAAAPVAAPEEPTQDLSWLLNEGEDGEDTGEEFVFDGEDSEFLFRELFEQGSGATEWAVHGWYKFTTPEDKFMGGSEKYVTVLRLVFNDERKGDLNDALNVGDQVLSLVIGNSGNLILCTGNNRFKLRDRPNPSECVSSPYENDLHAWTWFYIGYSRAEQKIRFFVQYEDHAWETSVSEVVHFVPHWSAVYIGGDPFKQSFAGHIRELELLYGA